jgi:CheY-like chemotaxis protein
MGGVMWAESTVGEGSTFYFTVVVRDTEKLPAPQPPNPAIPLLKDRSLLIVLHGGRERDALERYSQRWQMKFLSAGDAATTRQLIKGQRNWDAAVIDLDLPDEDGLSLAASLLSQPAFQGKPILLHASRNRLNIRQRAADAGIQTVLYEPLKPDDLLAALVLSIVGKTPGGAMAAARINAFDANLGHEHPLDILLAEDNVVNQKVALLLLDRLGYRADVAASGQEVIDAIQRQHYDVILMDVHMPEMDGIEATQRLFELLPADAHPYVIAMTAAAMQEDRERCRQVGMHNFISKPVKVEELVRALLQARAWHTSQVKV